MDSPDYSDVGKDYGNDIAALKRAVGELSEMVTQLLRREVPYNHIDPFLGVAAYRIKGLLNFRCPHSNEDLWTRAEFVIEMNRALDRLMSASYETESLANEEFMSAPTDALESVVAAVHKTHEYHTRMRNYRDMITSVKHSADSFRDHLIPISALREYVERLHVERESMK